MSAQVSYNFYRSEVFAAATIAATTQTSAVHMTGLPFGIDPKLLVSFLVKSTGETGSSTTMDIQMQGSADNSTFMDMGAAETQLTEDPGTGVIYIPDFSSKYYRLDLIGSYSTDFLGFEVQAVVATQGYRVDGA